MFGHFQLNIQLSSGSQEGELSELTVVGHKSGLIRTMPKEKSEQWIFNFSASASGSMLHFDEGS